MTSPNVIRRLEEKAVVAEQMITHLQKELTELKELSKIQNNTSQQCRELAEENKKLSQQIEEARQQLIRLEIANGKIQNPLPTTSCTPSTQLYESQLNSVAQPSVAPTAAKVTETKKGKLKATEVQVTNNNGEAQLAGGKVKKAKKPQPQKQHERAEDDVSRLDLRVGLIVSAERHPDADALYVEKVDIGAEQQLTVVSGLAGRIPLEEMQNRPVILLCNLKPAKMRGIVSQAMVMCASDPGGKIEILAPPIGAVPGERVALEGTEEFSPPDTQLKGKVWEAIAAKLRTRSDLVAGFDGKALVVPGKGNVTTTSLAQVPIK